MTDEKLYTIQLTRAEITLLTDGLIHITDREVEEEMDPEDRRQEECESLGERLLTLVGPAILGLEHGDG